MRNKTLRIICYGIYSVQFNLNLQPAHLHVYFMEKNTDASICHKIMRPTQEKNLHSTLYRHQRFCFTALWKPYFTTHFYHTRPS